MNKIGEQRVLWSRENMRRLALGADSDRDDGKPNAVVVVVGSIVSSSFGSSTGVSGVSFCTEEASGDSERERFLPIDTVRNKVKESKRRRELKTMIGMDCVSKRDSKKHPQGN